MREDVKSNVAGARAKMHFALVSELVPNIMFITKYYNFLLSKCSIHDLNEERKKVGRNKRSVSGMDELRKLRKRYVSSLK
jgi:hypothetical protein